MARSKTPAKRALQAEKRRLRNNMQKSKVKTELKKYQTVVASGNKEAAAEELKVVVSMLDKCVIKGLMHRNTVARKKSQLAKQCNQMGQAVEPAAEA